MELKLCWVIFEKIPQVIIYMLYIHIKYKYGINN